MLRLAWFCVYIFKYLLAGIFLGVILGMLFPPAGGILFLLCILGGFSAAWEDLMYRAGSSSASDIAAENEGFEEALRHARRNLM
jgi:hypothetical protein